jgi:hypothetical protein
MTKQKQTYRKEIGEAFSRIIDYDIPDENITKNGNVINISVIFTDSREAVNADNRLRQAGIISNNLTKVWQFSFADNSDSIKDLKIKMNNGIVKRFIEDIEKSYADADLITKRTIAKKIMQDAALTLEIGPTQSPGSKFSH